MQGASIGLRSELICSGCAHHLLPLALAAPLDISHHCNGVLQIIDFFFAIVYVQGTMLPDPPHPPLFSKIVVGWLIDLWHDRKSERETVKIVQVIGARWLMF